MVTHRVVQIIEPNLPGGEPSFVTKGDANAVPDEKPVKPVQIRGAVWYTVPWIGWVNNLVNGDMRAVVIPLVAIALFGYAGYLRGLASTRETQEATRGRRTARQPLRRPRTCPTANPRRNLGVTRRA